MTMMRRWVAALSFLCVAAALGQAPDKAAPGDSQTDPRMAQMQARMATMQALMERLRNTKDPEERQRLLQEHMQSMQQGMTMMGEMMRGPMGSPQQCQRNDTDCRVGRMQMQQQMMGQRMGMMQQMMQQMSEHMMLQEQPGRGPGAVTPPAGGLKQP
jgi:hypothetical protein